MDKKARALALRDKGITLDEIQEPFVIAHRGGAHVYPENTLDAYIGCVANGMLVIEQDLHELADGSLVCMHDETVDRTTSSTGNVSDYHASAWQKLVVDASSYMTVGYKDTRPPFFEEVLQQFGNKVIYAPECKNYDISQKVVDTVLRHGLKDNVIIQSFDLDSLAPAVAAGMKTLYLTNVTAAQMIKDAGITYVGVSSTGATDSYVASLVAVGLKPVVYTIQSRYEWDLWKAKGCVACFSDDPLWTSGIDTHKRTTDPFKHLTWYHGQLNSFGTKGGFLTSPARWGWGSQSNNFVLQGWGCPIESTTYSITFSVKYEHIVATSNWASIVVCSPIDFFADSGNALSKGYNIYIRATGEMNISLVQNNGFTAKGFKATEAITQGQTATFRVDVTPTSITITRTDTATQYNLSTNDTTFRGPYFFFGTKSTGATFHSVTIS